MGGQRTSPKEQKTQQSPAFGCAVFWQAGQVHRTTQASTGIVAVWCSPQEGQVRVELRTTVMSKLKSQFEHAAGDDRALNFAGAGADGADH